MFNTLIGIHLKPLVELSPQKPILAKQAQAVFSGGQQEGHFLPAVYTGFSPALQNPNVAKQSQVWSGERVMLTPGQHASPQSHFAGGFLSHLGQSCLHRLVFGRRYGGSQKPILAKHAQAVFSGGQHEGHFLPGEYTGFSPALQNPSVAKHSQDVSGVLVRFCPGQQLSHLHVAGGFALHSGQSDEQIVLVGSASKAVAAGQSAQKSTTRKCIMAKGELQLLW